MRTNSSMQVFTAGCAPIITQTDTTELHNAAKQGNFRRVVSLVIHGAEITTLNREGKTAMQLAAEKGHGRIVAYLKSLIT